jgi:hypothetical protein
VNHFGVALNPDVVAAESGLVFRYFLTMQDSLIRDFDVVAELFIKVKSRVSFLRRVPQIAFQQQRLRGTRRVWNELRDKIV